MFLCSYVYKKECILYLYLNILSFLSFMFAFCVSRNTTTILTLLQSEGNVGFIIFFIYLFIYLFIFFFLGLPPQIFFLIFIYTFYLSSHLSLCIKKCSYSINTPTEWRESGEPGCVGDAGNRGIASVCWSAYGEPRSRFWCHLGQDRSRCQLHQPFTLDTSNWKETHGGWCWLTHPFIHPHSITITTGWLSIILHEQTANSGYSAIKT